MILENMIENIKGVAVKAFNQSKSHNSTYIMNIDGKIEVMMAIWTCQKDKDDTVNMIKNMIKSGKLKEFIFISESWVVSLDKNKDPKSNIKSYLGQNGSLSNHPDREEALFIQYSSPQKERTFKANIDRKENDVTLGEWEDMGEEKFDKTFPFSEGRMQNIFAIASADNN